MIWLLVGIGGALGSMARHGLNQIIHQRALSSTFPIGIFTINVLGSIVIGVVSGIIASGRWSAPYEARVFVSLHVCHGQECHGGVDQAIDRSLSYRGFR